MEILGEKTREEAPKILGEKKVIVWKYYPFGMVPSGARPKGKSPSVLEEKKLVRNYVRRKKLVKNSWKKY